MAHIEQFFQSQGNPIIEVEPNGAWAIENALGE
jgi:hypothetical protein